VEFDAKKLLNNNEWLQAVFNAGAEKCGLPNVKPMYTLNYVEITSEFIEYTIKIAFEDATGKTLTKNMNVVINWENVDKSDCSKVYIDGVRIQKPYSKALDN